MEDVELKSVALNTPLNRTLEKNTEYNEEFVETSKGGKILVAWRGDRKKAALLTYHDLGLNYISNFQAFFNYPDMKEILQYFCVYHINAPGQEEGAPSLPDDFQYPTMDELAEQLNEVINAMKIVKYVGIGVGLGGNILLRHALEYPERVDSLMLVSTVCTAPGWIEWGYQKKNISQLRTNGVVTQAVSDYLLWHHFGYNYWERSHDLVNIFKHYFDNDIQPKNLALLTEQYNWRTPIKIQRDESHLTKNSTTIQVPVLNISGAYNPYLEESVTLNGRLNPHNSSWMKIQDSSMILEEQPAKVAEAFRLFVQGQGYCLKIRKPNAVGIVQ